MRRGRNKKENELTVRGNNGVWVFEVGYATNTPARVWVQRLEFL